jgi:hypothetical protein
MQRQVDELTRQRDSITSHLAQLRQLLGGAPLPGMDAPSPEPAVAAAPAKPALAAASASSSEASASSAASGSKAEAKAEDDAEWWQE